MPCVARLAPSSSVLVLLLQLLDLPLVFCGQFSQYWWVFRVRAAM